MRFSVGCENRSCDVMPVVAKFGPDGYGKPGVWLNPLSTNELAEQAAIDAWNTRVTKEKRDAKVKSAINSYIKVLEKVMNGYTKKTNLDKLHAMIHPATLSDLPELGKAILKGQVKGRVVVDVNA